MPEFAQEIRSVTTKAGRQRFTSERRFYIGAAVLIILISVAGFGPSIIDHSRRIGPPSALVIVHGLVTAAWLLLFLVQTVLVAADRLTVHRRMGPVAIVVAALILTVGPVMLIENVRRGTDLSGDLTRLGPLPSDPAERAATLVAPLSGFLVFGVLVSAGLWYRRRPAIHKRLMLIGSLSLCGPPLFHLAGYLTGHWPAFHGFFLAAAFVIDFVLLFTSAVNDRLREGRTHPVSLWAPAAALACVVAIPPLVMPLPAWQRVALWLVY
jgi:hypothetical protein